MRRCHFPDVGGPQAALVVDDGLAAIDRFRLSLGRSWGSARARRLADAAGIA
jgi:hypothetical protein